MRVTSRSSPRLVGYVEVKVASQVFTLPVQAAPVHDAEGTAGKLGFLSEGHDGYSILIDADASDAEKQAAIVLASAEAERFISRKVLN
jgi:hypothetical protein